MIKIVNLLDEPLMPSFPAFAMLCFAGALALQSTGCAQAPVKPQVEAYQPRFVFDIPPAGEKISVTVGVVAPAFVGDGIAYNTQNKDDDTVRGMVRGVRSSFATLLIAKGFNVTGPFEGIDDMTFPEKKGSDFVLYPELDLDGGVMLQSKGVKARPTTVGGMALGLLSSKKNSEIPLCSYSIAPKGTINIVAREPLSKEKMWVKKLELTGAAFSFDAEGDDCAQGHGWPQEVRNAWAHSHENMFKMLMTALNAQVNAEEFQGLKRQSQELREKKVY
jgi:hypothetical protein